MIAQARLKEQLHYDPLTGAFTWLDCQKWTKNKPAGGVDRDSGYRKIGVDGKRYYAHRLAWLYMTGEWPSRLVDHRDLNRSNNCWDNLRMATDSQNNANTPIYRNNRVGLKGVTRHQGRYMTQISQNKKTMYVGVFSTPEEAHEAYLVAAKRIHGEFARGA